MGKTKKHKVYTPSGVEIVLGHKECVLKRPFPWVPKSMGWLWTARDVAGAKYDPRWRPGAIPRSVFRRGFGERAAFRDAAGPPAGGKAARQRRGQKGGGAPGPSGSGEQEEEHKPAILIRKTDGQIAVTLQQMRNLRSRQVTDYPYAEDEPPYTMKVLGQASASAGADADAERPRVPGEGEAARRRLVYREAFGNVCAQIFERVDKLALRALSAADAVCPCAFLESRVVDDLVRAFLSEHPHPLGRAHLDAETDRSFVEQFLQSILRGGRGTDDAGGAGGAGGEEWSVEFTPPCAKFAPHSRVRQTRNAEAQTRRVETDPDNARSVSMSASTGQF